MAKIRVLGEKGMVSLVRRGRMFRDNMQENRRKATCKVCGCEIPKGEGIRWFRFAPRNDFHFNHNFLCPACDTKWGFEVGIFMNPDPFFWETQGA